MDFKPYNYKLYLIGMSLKVHTDGGSEGASTGGVEIVVADIGQTEIVGKLRIEEIELHTTAESDATVEAVEAFLVEGAVGLAMTEVLDLTTHPDGQEASRKGLHTEAAVNVNLILHEEGHLEIVKAVCELSAFVAPFTAFLDVVEACLEIDR